MAKDTLSLPEARRIALAAQGFAQPDRSSRANWTRIAKTVDALHLLQIDSVNVLVRSHYLPLYARLGAYDMAALDARSFANNSKRHFFECWAHEASLVPMKLHPLMRWRMERARAGDGIYSSMDRFGREEKAYLEEVLHFINANGPTRASEVPGGGKADGGWWGWSKGKMALETLFDQGLVTTATRKGFERLYDLPERVIPADILNLPTPPEAETFRTLLDMSGAALGIATETDLRDYFRLPVAEARKALAEAVEEGTLRPVSVEGWRHQAYLHKNAKLPRKAGGIALLSPFDPLVWNRDRAERLFGFHYRIELYTPEAKRKFGYYVLPFLHGEKLAGRLCLKAERASSTLKVNRSHAEPGEDHELLAQAMAKELGLMASWLQLDNFEIGKAGGLARQLSKASKAAAGASLQFHRN